MATETSLKVRLLNASKTHAEWTSADPVLKKGEIAYSSDKKQIRVGDGSSKWSQLSYIDAGHIVGLSNSGSTITYTKADGSTGTITLPAYSVATSSTPGLVKSGGNITVASDGSVTVNTAITANQVSGTTGSVNADRHVWFSDSVTETVRNYDDDFKYNPNTNTLKVAKIDGVELTGTPKAPTAASGTNTTQIATTAFVQGEIDNIEIGGRNLLTGINPTTEISKNIASTASGGSVEGLTYTVTTISGCNTYTVSFEAKSETNGTQISCYWYSPNTTIKGKSSTGETFNNTSGSDGHCKVTLTTEWKRYWVTWTQNSTDVVSKHLIIGRIFKPSEGSITCTYRAPKFEVGNVATDWFPAPEDLVSSLSLSGSTLSYKNPMETQLGSITLTKSTVGLGNVDNTSDVNKPISTATQTALDDKVDKKYTIVAGTDLNTVTTSGFYRINNNLTNTPTSYAFGQMIVVQGGGDTISQIVMPYSSSSMYLRSGNPFAGSGNGAWQPWVRLIDETYGDTLYLGKTATATAAATLAHKTLDNTTLHNTAGSFAFSGSGEPWAGNDWVGLQIGNGNDKFQITARSNSLLFRQNDSGGTNTSWSEWVTMATSGNVGTGDNNGQVKIAGTNVSVKGLGSAAYTASTAYATATQGTKADNALPLSGGTLTNTDNVTYTVSAGTVIKPNTVSILQSPVPKYLWHDLWAFCWATTPKYYITTDGSTWTESTLNKELFAHKENISSTYVINTNQSGARWEWIGGGFAYCSCAWVVIGVAYSSNIAKFDVLLESSSGSDESATWTTLGEATNVSANQVPIWIKVNGSSQNNLRLTITRNASSNDTTILPIVSLRLLSFRWGNQGKGSEYEYPYNWDGDMNITIPGNLIVQKEITANSNVDINGNLTIGSGKDIILPNNYGIRGMLSDGSTSNTWMLYMGNDNKVHLSYGSREVISAGKITSSNGFEGKLIGHASLDLPLTAGSSVPLSNSLYITKASECGVEVNNTQSTNPNQVAFIVGSSGKGGIYSRKHSKWIVYSDASGSIRLEGTADIATTAYELHQISGNRPTSANINSNNNGGLRVFLATSAMTAANGKPAYDAHIIHLDWDNSNTYASQLAVAGTSTTHGCLAIRGQQSDKTWTDWAYVYDTAHKPTAIDVGAVPMKSSPTDLNTIYDTSVTNITGGSLANGPTTYGYGEVFTMAYRKPSGNTIPDYAAQIYMHYNANTTKNTMYYRTSSQTAWNAWQQVAHASIGGVGDAGTPVYMDTDGTLKETQLKLDDVDPICSKTYTGLYGSANDAAGASFYFMTVKPTTYYTMWKIRYRIHCWVPNQNTYDSYADVEMWGYQSTYSGYKAYNAHSYEGSTIHRCFYFHNLYRATQVGLSAYGHAIGLGLRASTNPTSSSYPRSFTIDLLEAENCTVTMLSDATKYASLPGTGSTNYSGLTEFDGYNNGLRETGDDNTVTMLRIDSSTWKAGAGGLMAYGLFMEDSNGTYQSFTITNGTGTNKTKNTTGFRLPNIWYANIGSNVTANNNTGGSVGFVSINVDARYSINASSITAHAPLYLVGTLGTDGLFYLDNTWWTQTLPTSEDGKLYVYLGRTYSTTSFHLTPYHPIYWYKDGAVREFYVPEATANVSGLMSKADKIKSDSWTSIKNLASATNLGWVSQTNDKTILLNSNALAYWNGRYNDNASNLAYCNKGAFGSIVTKNTGDYIPISGSTGVTGTIQTTGNLRTRGTAETQIGVGYKTEDTERWFYLCGNNSTGTRGIYDTKKGYVILTTDTSSRFYGTADNASALTNFKVTTTTSLGLETTTNAIGYISGLTKADWNYQQADGALYTQFYSGDLKHQIYGDYRTGHLSVRGKNSGTWQDWKRVLDEDNYKDIADDRYVLKGGDTMTGDLLVSKSSSTQCSLLDNQGLGLWNTSTSNSYPQALVYLSIDNTLNIVGETIRIGGYASGELTSAPISMNGDLTVSGHILTKGTNLIFGTTGPSSDDNGGLVWFYGNGQEKMRIWSDNDYTSTTAPYFREYKKDGTSLYTGNLVLGNGVGASGVWGITSTSVKIQDYRNTTVTPGMGDKLLNAYFMINNSNNTLPSDQWWSVLHMRGWDGSYVTWEIAGPSHNVDQRTTPLYVRTSNTNTAWGSWRKIYDTSNKPEAVLDSGNSTVTTFKFSAAGLGYNNFTWLAGWNGYELRAVNKGLFLSTSTGGTVTGSISCAQSSGTTYVATHVADKSEAYVGAKNNTHAISLTTTQGNSAGIWYGTKSKWVISVNTSGTVTANTSDIRYKNYLGLTSEDEVNAILSNIQIHNFIYKDDTENHLEQNGIFAQELRDVLIEHNIGMRPYLLIQEKDKQDIYYDLTMPEEDVIYSVAYDKFVPLLWKGWQMHNEKLIKLSSHEQRILELENRVRELELQLNNYDYNEGKNNE